MRLSIKPIVYRTRMNVTTSLQNAPVFLHSLYSVCSPSRLDYLSHELM